MQEFRLNDLPTPDSLKQEQAENTNYVVKLESYDEMLKLVDWASKARSFAELTYFVPNKPDVYAYGDIRAGERDIATMAETGIVYCKTMEELEPLII